MAELKFKCPECGHDKLVEEASCDAVPYCG